MSRTAMITAGSCVLVLTAAAGCYRRFWSQRGSLELTEIGLDDDDDDDDDCITADEVVQVMDRLFLEMQAVLAALMQQVQAIQMSGTTVPEKQLRGLLRGEMERALLVKQALVVEAMDMDYECLEQATWEFLEQDEEHPAVKKAVERFQRFWEHATGEPVVGWRPKGSKSAAPGGAGRKEPYVLLDPEPLIAVAERYFSSLTDCMREIVEAFKEQGKNLQDAGVQQELNMLFAQQASDAGETALEQQGVTLEQFEASIKAHANTPAVARALSMLQMKQQQDLMAIGATS
jgi:hypothetical protein